MAIIGLSGGLSSTYLYAMRKRYGVLVDLFIIVANGIVTLWRVSVLRLSPICRHTWHSLVDFFREITKMKEKKIHPIGISPKDQLMLQILLFQILLQL
jgi:hypothetical protein